jgi:hypothetical protein
MVSKINWLYVVEVVSYHVLVLSSLESEWNGF